MTPKNFEILEKKLQDVKNGKLKLIMSCGRIDNTNNAYLSWYFLKPDFSNEFISDTPNSVWAFPFKIDEYTNE